ncbi:Z1 domain-containing protein [Geodermatophilus sp. URMC 63]
MTDATKLPDAASEKEMAELENILAAILAGAVHSEAHLVDTVQRFQPVSAPYASREQIEGLIRRLTQRLTIDVEQGVALTAAEFTPWLAEKRRSIVWARWRNYKQWMLNTGRPPRVVEKMDELTDDILDFAGDPTAGGSWARRGLVIGDVQSGKTSTYLGLFNKAADAGYRLIIVLAGNTESLRQQTQERVDEGFIGRDSSLIAGRRGLPKQTRLIGIGSLNQTLAHAHGMTTVLQDFKTSSLQATNISLNAEASDPYVFVVKKNKAVLAAVTQWLSQQPKSGPRLSIPLLLLDDESDYASVNTRAEGNPTEINAAIRGILGLFARSSYVAFTATPFANIFIDHDVENDLFPRDFIYSLESPSNYFGSERTFGTPDQGSNVTVDLLDVEPFVHLGHRSSHQVGPVPNSLKDAIRVFLLANAIRDIRGQISAGRSMLVNVSRYKRVQAQVFIAVESELTRLRLAVEFHSDLRNADIASLKASFDRHFAGLGIPWSEVLASLPSATSDVRVQLFNSDKDRALTEEEGRWERPARLIAVGGDVLSRGLTLDGLMVSYFYRRVAASDTLLQMARWFGYRDGYEDLCRVWIDPSSAADYRFVAEATSELKRSLRLMLRQRLTPADFGLAVRKHPGALLVTAKNKMRAAETTRRTISLLGRRVETTKLSSDPSDISANATAVGTLGESTLASDAFHRAVRGTNICWSMVPKEVVANFLREYRPHKSDAIFSMPALASFVERSRQFPHWDIMVVSGGEPKKFTFAGDTVTAVGRQLKPGTAGELRVSGSSSRLAGSQDVGSLLNEADLREAREMFRRDNGGGTPPETAYYRYLPRPALMIYPLWPRPSDDALGDAGPTAAMYLGVKIALPGEADTRDTRGDVEYVINTVAQRNWFVEVGEDEDDVDD